MHYSTVDTVIVRVLSVWRVIWIGVVKTEESDLPIWWQVYSLDLIVVYLIHCMIHPWIVIDSLFLPRSVDS